MDDRATLAALRASPPFDPEAGTVIARPIGSGPGHWAGAPGVAVVGDRVAIAYRLRAPAPERGHTLAIATSDDGVRFSPVASISKRDLGALSIERCALIPHAPGLRLLISFVSRSDRRWRIEEMAIADPTFHRRFDVSARRVVLTADDVRGVAVKDPWVRRIGDAWYLFVSFAPPPVGGTAGLHAAGDALSSGRTGSFTGLAMSADGEHWTWRGAVLGPDAARWDGYTARLTTAVRTHDGWIGFYDGGTFEGNYEERCGVAFSDDLVQWRKAEADGPLVGTPSGPGGVRYVDVTTMPDGSLRAYYEYTRADGAHELRTAPLGRTFG